MNKKSGLTMTSIVLYVILFFAFSAFAVAMSTNMNYKALSEKGNVWISEQSGKLQYNLIKSAKASTIVDTINGKIGFSNGDEYYYDASKRQIKKNGGILVTDVESFRLLSESEMSNQPISFSSNIDKNIDNICLEAKFKKYNQEKIVQIIVTVGDE